MNNVVNLSKRVNATWDGTLLYLESDETMTLTRDELKKLIKLAQYLDLDTPASMSDPKQYYQCERCGGTGQQEADLWDGTGYNSTAGTCTDCGGSGKLR